ncbi:hypothetical protein FA13DRAFT_1567496, partial [Coprinellus micaceus]
YVPTAQELDTLSIFIEQQHAMIDAIDAEISGLTRKRAAHLRCVDRHQALTSLVRRLPDDILVTIFLEWLASAEPWPSPHPPVIASSVCRRWRNLAVGTPLLW